MSDERVTFMHVPIGSGRVTIAIRYRHKATEEQYVVVAFAFAAPGDRFVRRVGRAKAAGRLDMKHPTWRSGFMCKPGDRLRDRAVDALAKFVRSGGAPSWTRGDFGLDRSTIGRSA